MHSIGREEAHFTATQSVTLYREQNGLGPRFSWKEIHRLFCRFEQHVYGKRYSENLLKLSTDITHRFEQPSGTYILLTKREANIQPS